MSRKDYIPHIGIPPADSIIYLGPPGSSSIGEIGGNVLSDIKNIDFSDILGDPNLSRREKVRKVKIRAGLLKERGTKEDISKLTEAEREERKKARKEARRQKAENKKLSSRQFLGNISPDLLPKTKGKKSKEDKSKDRLEHAKDKRAALRYFINKYPAEAMARGLNPDDYKD